MFMVTTAKRERLTIDLTPEEHRKIKSYAAFRGKTLKEFVLESIKTKMALEAEQEDLHLLTTKPTEVLMEIWDNDRDAAYDKL
jgi:uncharacterized protein (DUF1778 family)